MQRCAISNGSLTDLNEAFELGKRAFSYALKGETGIMSTLKRVNNSPYEVEYNFENISKIANKEKVLPKLFINETENGITDDGFEYFLPLIQGDFEVQNPTACQFLAILV